MLMRCKKVMSVEEDDVSVTPCCTTICIKDSCKRLWCTKHSKPYHSLNFFFSIILGLLFGGGGIFNALEGPSEIQRIKESRVAYNESVSTILELVISQTNLTDVEAMELTNWLIELGRQAAEANGTLTTKGGAPTWDWSSSIFFCVTVMTTIGYGTIVPVTAGGQIFLLFYAIISIPLAFMFLAAIGEIIQAWVDKAMHPVNKRYGPIASHFTGMCSLFLFSLVFYILIPAGIFTAIEDWNYRESVYFAVVTLTTVGFGDFVPGGEGVNASMPVRGLYKMMSAVWIWIGLSLVTTFIFEVQCFLEAFAEWWCSPRNFLCRWCYSKLQCSGNCGGDAKTAATAAPATANKGLTHEPATINL